MPKALPADVFSSLDRFFETYRTERVGNCRIWKGSLDTDGYGLINTKHYRGSVHRLVYRLAYGIDPAGFVVMHDCDTPACCEPKHLILGTQHDNIADRHAKGRNGAACGEAAPWSKLTEADVARIRADFIAKRPRTEIIAQFNISKTQLYRIAKGESWNASAV